MIRWFLTAAVVLTLAGCAGKQKVPDSTDPAEQEKLEVSAEKVAECPCGDPDWSKLPEGSDPPEESE